MSEPRLTPEQLASLAELADYSVSLNECELAAAVPALLEEIAHLKRERDDARAFLRQAHDANWTPTALDKLNTWARQEGLRQTNRPEELPAQIDAVIFHFQKLATRFKDERDQVRNSMLILAKSIDAALVELQTSRPINPNP